MTDAKEHSLPLMGHLEELRDRLKKSAISIIIGFLIAYYFSEELFYILAMPLKAKMPEEGRLIFTNLPEMFFTYLKISFVAGLMIASPYIFLQLWKFIAPGLYKHEQQLMLPFVFVSTFLFIAGALFGYFVVFPFGFEFFLNFSNNLVQALPSVREYFSLALMLLVVFGAIFELPVILFFLAKLGIITPKFLKEKRKYAIVLAFIIGAILTPPDVFTQILMAIPLIILYEISIFATRFARPIKKEKEEEAGEDDDEEEGKEKEKNKE